MTDIENGWKLDRRIPIAVIVALLLQLAGALIWATELDARVSGIERQSLGSSGMSERFARMEERLDNVRQDMQGMKRQLDRLTERLLKP